MNWRLIFSGTQSTGWTISVCLAVTLAVVLFLMLRRYEARLVSRSVGWTLMTLRILVLIVLLITMMQPVLTRSWDEDTRSRLVVGFDVSDSMETADSHATPAEMLRWAQALGMLGNDSTDELLNQWLADYESGKQPDWGQGDADLGQIRKRHVEGVFSELGEMARTEFVRRLLKSKPNNLLERLSDTLDTDLQVFGADAQAIPSEQLQQLLDSDRAELKPGATDAIGMLGDSIGDEDGAQIQAIVLFSDGRQTVSVDASAEASRLGSLGIPVYTVPIGSIRSPRDLSVAAVQVPQSVFLKDNAQVQVTMVSGGFVGDEISVRLERDGVEVDRRTVTVSADTFEVEFEIATDEAGTYGYSVATDVQQGELRDDNNSREFTVSVVDNKARVMLVEGDARWEFRYLKSALDRDKQVELSTVLFRQPYLQLLNRTFLDAELPPENEFSEKLAEMDLLIIGDVESSLLPETVWQAVEKAIADDGLTLLIVPGHRHMPHQYSSPILSKLLPVTNTRQREAERLKRSIPDSPPSAFRLAPSPEARDLTLFDIVGPDDEDQDMTLSALPGHPWACTGTPKPIASVWARVELDGVDVNPEDMAAVVHQYYGFGQVVWFGIDSTWRWRRRAGDRWHHRFWGQLVRWAAQNKSSAGNDQVRMTLSDILIDEFESSDVSVRWNPNLVPQLEGATVEVLVQPEQQNKDPLDDAGAPGEAVEPEPRRVQLEPLEGSPERFSGRLTGLKPGTYDVQLNVEDSRLQLDTPIESELIVQKKLSTELANINCNREFLQQLATLSGGEMLEPWQVSDLPDILRPEDTSENIVQEKTLWDHWLLLLLFFVLLTAEWIIRKMNGLP